MGIHFNIDPPPHEFEQEATDLLRRAEKGEEVDPVADWPVLRLIIILTPDFDLEHQSDRPLAITCERVALAIEAYRAGDRSGVRTYCGGWVPA